MRTLTGLCILSLASATPLLAAEASFSLETREPFPYTAAYLGNGQMGVSTSPLGTQPTQCFMAGVYDHATGDVPRLALLPAWNEVDVFDGSAWLNQSSADGLTSYHQTLDMYGGVLRTQYEWRGGQAVSPAIGVEVETFVSRSEPNLAAVRVALTPHSDGPLRVRFPLRAWPAPKRLPLARIKKLTGPPSRDQWLVWYPGHMTPHEAHAEASPHHGILELLSQGEGTNTAVAEAVALTWPPGARATAPDRSTVEVAFRAVAGRTYVFRKFAVLIRSDSLRAAEMEADRAQRRGWMALLAESSGAWHELWQSDVVVEGDAQLQTVIHSMLFYLLASARAGSELSIPPMGLSTAGYYGHVFWDADTYMFPPLLLLHPEIAASLVMFRAGTLDAARANARKNGYRGAMYPWEAGPDGSETTPRFAYQNALRENHVSADVALAAWQYYLATGNREWLAHYGFPILRDTAEFWTSRVHFNARKARYEIGNVVSVKESRIGVSNDPYTNAAAKKNLEVAIQAAKTLHIPSDPKWAEIASKLWLPAKDTILIDYPLELPLTLEERMRLARHAVEHEPEGAMMGGEFSPILGVELHNRQIVDALLSATWRPYLRPPFSVLSETPENQNVNFITGAGAFLQQFLYGYSGLRLSENGLMQAYTPLLPASVTRLVLKGVQVRGSRRDISIPPEADRSPR